MTARARITGMGWVTPFSVGRPGHTIRPASPDRLPELSGKSVLTVPWKSFGRMDDFSKTGFSAIAFAMADAGIPPVAGLPDAPGERHPIPLIAESRTGCLETDLAYQATLHRHGMVMPSPALFAYTLPSSFLGEAAIYFGLTGESYMIDTTGRPGLTALSLAMDCLDSGNTHSAVCGVCNSDTTDFSGSAPATPGALFIVLSRENARPDSGGRITIKRDHQDRFYAGDREITALTDLVPKEDL